MKLSSCQCTSTRESQQCSNNYPVLTNLMKFLSTLSTRAFDVGTMPLHRVCWTGVRYIYVLTQLPHSEWFVCYPFFITVLSGSFASNYVLITYWVQWLSWGFSAKETKKEKIYSLDMSPAAALSHLLPTDLILAALFFSALDYKCFCRVFYPQTKTQKNPHNLCGPATATVEVWHPVLLMVEIVFLSNHDHGGCLKDAGPFFVSPGAFCTCRVVVLADTAAAYEGQKAPQAKRCNLMSRCVRTHLAIWCQDV